MKERKGSCTDNRISEEMVEALVDRAFQVLPSAYAPYSHFHVAAALLCSDGSVYTGCNVENASYPAGNCAERTAIFKAVSEGKREFSCIVIVGGKRGKTRRVLSSLRNLQTGDAGILLPIPVSGDFGKVKKRL